MPKNVIAWMLFLSILVLGGCSEERDVAPMQPDGSGDIGAGVDTEAFAWALVEQAGWPVEASDEDH